MLDSGSVLVVTLLVSVVSAQSEPIWSSLYDGAFSKDATLNLDIGDASVSGGCQGNLRIYRSSPNHGTQFADICDRNFGTEEAVVACRQLGCNPEGAMRIDARWVRFGLFSI